MHLKTIFYKSKWMPYKNNILSNKYGSIPLLHYGYKRAIQEGRFRLNPGAMFAIAGSVSVPTVYSNKVFSWYG